MKAEEEITGTSPEDFLLPSRSKIHPSTKRKLTKVFYTTIISLFILLILSMIGMFLYSNKG